MANPTVRSTLSADAQKITCEALQSALVDLIDLSLLAKQAHWNVVGRNFRSIHQQLDEVVDTARNWMDVFAERAAAVGITPDGRPSTVAETSGVPTVDAGWLRDTAVVDKFVEIYGVIIGRMRERIAETQEPDPVTQDLFIAATGELEKQHWMFQAERDM
jgi:starvation-inducible DNA-binding protein